ncbi:hypothetical protein CBM2606_A140144 [Cupriavidus taiwanensis]|nr:hypothetical protein CBM2606_A140144 [Cupriavidus taiwanensis]
MRQRRRRQGAGRGRRSLGGRRARIAQDCQDPRRAGGGPGGHRDPRGRRLNARTSRRAAPGGQRWHSNRKDDYADRFLVRAAGRRAAAGDGGHCQGQRAGLRQP